MIVLGAVAVISSGVELDQPRLILLHVVQDRISKDFVIRGRRHAHRAASSAADRIAVPIDA